MARIRTIKPEFPQSESMGRVSRDARLCFVSMWTLADDLGRLRGNSRMLASLLFPYDDDAPALIDSWLAELSAEGCIDRYEVAGSSYVQIANWLSHQKIDKPSASKLPSPEEGSRILANPRESSSLDQDQDQYLDQGGEREEAPRKRSAAQPSDLITAECMEAEGVNKQHARDWLKVRAKHKAPLTVSAWDGLKAEALRAGISAARAVQICAEKSWRGFDASWDWPGKAAPAQQSFAAKNAEAKRLLGIKNNGQEFIDA